MTHFASDVQILQDDLVNCFRDCTGVACIELYVLLFYDLPS